MRSLKFTKRGQRANLHQGHGAGNKQALQQAECIPAIHACYQNHCACKTEGVHVFRRGISAILEDAENGIPMPARHLFADLYGRFQQLDAKINEYDKQIERMAVQSEAAQRLRKLGGVGAKIATAVIASVGDAKLFKNGRQFVAWLGLVPRQHSSGGKARLGHISKRGDAYLRTLLIHGARAVLRVADKRKDPQTLWAIQVRERRGNNIAAVALAAKIARTIWAMLSKGTEYRAAAI